MALGDLSNPYDLIVIGKGSAAAYYLESLPERYHSLRDKERIPVTILVIGEADPWAGARGYTPSAYGQNVNQATQVLDHRTGKTAPTSQDPQDRLDWAGKNAAIIDACADKVVTATVRYVGKVTKTALTKKQKFKVTTDAQADYYGYKIVIASGAGIETPDKGHVDYHNVPGEVKALLPRYAAQIMNLDQFMKLDRSAHAGKKVAIVGAFAGTDAVMQAGTLGYPAANVYWLMSK